MNHAHDSVRAQRRAFIGGAVVAVVGLLAALALVYTNATGVAEVAADARIQQQVESALGATASARNAVGQALIIAGSNADPVLTAAATAEARSVLDAMQERVDTVVASDPSAAGLDGPSRRAVAFADDVLKAIDAHDLQGASTIATGPSAAAFSELVADLSARRDDLAAAIAGAAAESSTVATASRFMVAFFVPSLAVFAALVVARRRRRREQLAQELEQERALNKSKDQLIANLSHELRTPLTGIYTSALAMEDIDFTDPDLTRELTGVIVDQSADLTRMVEDLLVSAQADAGRLRFDLTHVDVADLVRGLEREFERFDAAIAMTIEPGVVLADPGRLRQLMRNLISNAAKYGGGNIEVRGRPTESSYLLEVIDDGPGVPPEVEERMFERFVHRGDTPLIIGSVGLGLSISRLLAEGMHGSLGYARTDGATTFRVTLDAANPHPPALPPDPLPPSPATLHDEEEAPRAALESPRQARPR